MKRILLGGSGLVAAALALHGSWVASANAQASDDRGAAERALAEVAAFAWDAGAGALRAHGSGDAGQPAVERSSEAGAAAEPSIVRGPVTEAERALERARGARAAGDVHHGELLEGLAREWAETARDVLRASLLERQATLLETNDAESTTRAQRARALLEEDVARRGRAQAELARISAGGTPFPTSASSANGRASSPRATTPAASASSQVTK